MARQAGATIVQSTQPIPAADNGFACGYFSKGPAGGNREYWRPASDEFGRSRTDPSDSVSPHAVCSNPQISGTAYGSLPLRSLRDETLMKPRATLLEIGFGSSKGSHEFGLYLNVRAPCTRARHGCEGLKFDAANHISAGFLILFFISPALRLSTSLIPEGPVPVRLRFPPVGP